MKHTKFAVFFLLILWSSPIGLEDLSVETPASGTKTSSNSSKSNLGTIKAKTLDSKTLNIASKVKIDQKQFIKQFSRQAVTLDLGHCLRTSLRENEGVIAVAGELEKGGMLTNVRMIDSEKELPTCAQQVISEMKFPDLIPPIEGAGHTIYWRIDW